MNIEPQRPALIMSFRKFAPGKYGRKIDGKRGTAYLETEHNLYIIWRGKQALYVGISRNGIWNRWFGTLSPHIFVVDGQWRADYSTPIGRAIVQNMPDSLRWKIELRHIVWTGEPGGDLAYTESELIRELHPLFNTVHLPELTEQELKVYEHLTRFDALTADRRRAPAVYSFDLSKLRR